MKMHNVHVEDIVGKDQGDGNTENRRYMLHGVNGVAVGKDADSQVFGGHVELRQQRD